MLFCEFCEIFKNTFSLEHLRTTASRYGVKALIFYLYFFIFLTEDLAMSVIQLLLVIFSKRLDNLFSVYGGLDLQICIYRKYAFRFTAFSFLFIVLYCKYDSESYFFQYVIHLFFLVFFFSFPFAFRSKMLKTSNFYLRLCEILSTSVNFVS